MPGRRFHTVDVFAPERYAGNQLAVFQDASDLATDEMLALTRETNYSEATFVEDAEPADDRYPVRIFDPAEEIPFAGHPTIGTAAVLREFVLDDRPDELVLALGVGDVPVWVETDDASVERYWMQQVEPTFGERVDQAAAAAALGLDPEDVLADAPIEVVSTGLPTLVVPLASLDAAERAATQPDAYEDLIVDDLGGCNLLVVAPETVADDADLHVRVFADWANVPEDPATGSSNGCLAAYLVEHDDVARKLRVDADADAGADAFADADVDTDAFADADAVADAVAVVVEQGIEMGRPSRLYLRASTTLEGSDDAGIDVRVGGRVVPVAEGNLL